MAVCGHPAASHHADIKDCECFSALTTPSPGRALSLGDRLRNLNRSLWTWQRQYPLSVLQLTVCQSLIPESVPWLDRLF